MKKNADQEVQKAQDAPATDQKAADQEAQKVQSATTMLCRILISLLCISADLDALFDSRPVTAENAGDFTADIIHAMEQSINTGELNSGELQSEIRELQPYLETQIMQAAQAFPADGGTLTRRMFFEWKDDAYNNATAFPICLRRAVHAADQAGRRQNTEHRQYVQRPPDTQISPNAKLTHTEIINALIEAGEVSGPAGEDSGRLVPVNKSSAPALDVYAAITVVNPGENTPDIKVNGHYTEYDRLVYDAVSTLYRGGGDSHTFTTDMIYRVMTGSNTRPSKGAKSAITKSMRKMRAMEVEINATEQIRRSMKRRHMEFSDSTVTVWRGKPMINYEWSTIRDGTGNRILTVYHLTEKPVLLEYSEQVGQVLSSKADVLDIRLLDDSGAVTERRLKNSEQVLLLKKELWRRVLLMKHNRKTYSSKIVFDTLFESLGLITSRNDGEALTAADRKTRERYRDYCFKILDYWKAIGFIAGYEVAKSGKNAIDGVTIRF